MLKKIFYYLYKHWKAILLILPLMLVIPIANAGIVQGNPRGTITLVEFFDYACPYCQVMGNTINQLMKNNPELRVVYRPIPILNRISWFAASSVIAASHQQNYQIFHQALLNNHQPLSENAILTLAAHEGLNIDQLLSDMKSPAVQQELEDNLAVANKLGVKYLPTVIIGKSQAQRPSTVFYGETGISQLQAAITNS